MMRALAHWSTYASSRSRDMVASYIINELEYPPTAIVPKASMEISGSVPGPEKLALCEPEPGVVNTASMDCEGPGESPNITGKPAISTNEPPGDITDVTES